MNPSGIRETGSLGTFERKSPKATKYPDYRRYTPFRIMCKRQSATRMPKSQTLTSRQSLFFPTSNPGDKFAQISREKFFYQIRFPRSRLEAVQAADFNFLPGRRVKVRSHGGVSLLGTVDHALGRGKAGKRQSGASIIRSGPRDVPRLPTFQKTSVLKRQKPDVRC